MPLPARNIVVRAGKRCKRCAKCSRSEGADVFHEISNFHKKSCTPSGLESSCAKWKISDRKKADFLARDRAAYARRRAKKGHKVKPQFVGPPPPPVEPRPAHYYSLMGDEEFLKQSFLARSWRPLVLPDGA